MIDTVHLLVAPVPVTESPPPTIPIFDFEKDVISAGRPKKRMGTPKLKVGK